MQKQVMKYNAIIVVSFYSIVLHSVLIHSEVDYIIIRIYFFFIYFQLHRLLLKSKEYFEYVLNEYPATDYALDSKFKLELINEILASKEMYLARYYFDREKWIPAINRFKLVVEKYDDSIFVEE